MIGQQLGPYAVLSKLGEGGMGEVYRGRDTKLDRDVAIKVLPASFADDRDRVARFEREAKTLASLNHPHIAQIYGLESANGTSALVMELVEGSDLSALIARGPIALADALPIARQIADALEAAHEQGIVHRDLTPQNIKVRADGTVKVLDFGLAKAADRALDSGSGTRNDLANSPTMTSPAMTGMGMILGTAAYMSPEQAKGRPVDKRADIWAFGVVLYEMLTGQRAFKGDDVSDLLVSVLRDTPDFATLPASTPARLRQLVQRCLEKDPKLRLRDIGEARLEIAKIESGAPDVSVVAPPRAGEHVTTGPVTMVTHTRTQARLPWVLSLALFFLLLQLLWQWAPWRASTASSTAIAHLSVTLPEGDELSTYMNPFTLSDDGSTVAYIAKRAGKPMVFVRAVSGRSAKALDGTEGAESPFFSPDAQWLGFFAGGKLKKIAVGGAALQTLADAPFERGGAWGSDGFIYFAPTNAGGIWRVPDGGGAVTPVSFKDTAAGEISHRWPQVIGDTLLFARWTGPGNAEQDIAAQRVTEKEHRIVTKAGNAPHYAAGIGVLFYAHLGELFAVPWNPSQADLGRAVPVTVGERPAMLGNEGVGNYAVSTNGTLIYVPGSRSLNANRLVWVDRAGKVDVPALPERDYEGVVLSPDGTRALVQLREGMTALWTYDIPRNTLTPIAPNAGSSQAPLWTLDGKRVIYRSTQKGLRNLFWRPVDGSGGEERLLTKADVSQAATSISPDGRWLLFNENGSAEVSGVGIWMMSLDGAHEVRPLFEHGGGEQDGQISPDGKWIAYQVSVSARWEIYVAPFPGPGPRRQISVDGGGEPLWSRDGHELFFQNGATLMTTNVTLGTTFSAGTPRPLYDGRFIKTVNGNTPWVVTADGKRFLRIQQVEPERAITSLDIVLNWFTELKPLLAGK